MRLIIVTNKTIRKHIPRYLFEFFGPTLPKQRNSLLDPFKKKKMFYRFIANVK